MHSISPYTLYILTEI